MNDPSIVLRKGLDLLGVDDFGANYGCSPKAAAKMWETIGVNEIELEAFLGALHRYHAFPTVREPFIDEATREHMTHRYNTARVANILCGLKNKPCTPAIPSLDGRDMWFHLGLHEYRFPATGGFRQAWHTNKLDAELTVKFQLSQYLLGAASPETDEIGGVEFVWVHGPHDPKKCDLDTAFEKAKKGVEPQVTSHVVVLAVVTKIEIQGE